MADEREQSSNSDSGGPRRPYSGTSLPHKASYSRRSNWRSRNTSVERSSSRTRDISLARSRQDSREPSKPRLSRSPNPSRSPTRKMRRRSTSRHSDPRSSDSSPNRTQKQRRSHKESRLSYRKHSSRSPIRSRGRNRSRSADGHQESSPNCFQGSNKNRLHSPSKPGYKDLIYPTEEHDSQNRYKRGPLIGENGNKPQRGQDRRGTSPSRLEAPSQPTTQNLRTSDTRATTPSQEKVPPKKEEPNFGLSGLLTAETNTFNGVVVKYNEPPEAVKPTSRWRWYAFKGEEQVDILHLHRQSAYLIGRDRKVADIPLEHASISKQHAVLQYRKVVEKSPETRQPRSVVKPYIIDLETTNGTFVNGSKIPPSRYFELRNQDVIKFAFSTREYVFLRED